MASPIIKTEVDNGILTITVSGHPAIVIDPADYPAELVSYAALHGFKQKYADAAALGAEATPAEKHAAIKALVDHHRDTGDWNRTGAGDGTSGDGLLVRAVMEFNGMERDAAREAVATLDKATQAAMRASPELEPIIRRIKMERPAPKAKVGVDTAGLLAQLKAKG